jgi:parvulin-like peptidyl-prolyl isomerase
MLLALGCGEPKVAAIVNGKKVYTQEVNEILEGVKKDHPLFFAGEGGRTFSTKAKKEILEGFIENILIEENAKKIGVEVGQEDIDGEIKRYEKMFGQKKIKEQMKKMGWSEKKLREEVRKSLLIRKVEEKVKGEVKVGEGEIESFYEKNKDRFKEPSQVKVAMIVLEKKEVALEVEKKARKGEDFLSLANSYSVDGETTGKFLWKKEGELPETVFKVAFNLKKGEVSKVIEENGKFYLVKLEEKKKESYRPLKEVRKSIEEELLYRKRLETWREWLKKLKKEAKIEIYLKI